MAKFHKIWWVFDHLDCLTAQFLILNGHGSHWFEPRQDQMVTDHIDNQQKWFYDPRQDEMVTDNTFCFAVDACCQVKQLLFHANLKFGPQYAVQSFTWLLLVCLNNYLSLHIQQRLKIWLISIFLTDLLI